jgi:hypothetical protein
MPFNEKHAVTRNTHRERNFRIACNACNARNADAEVGGKKRVIGRTMLTLRHATSR